MAIVAVTFGAGLTAGPASAAPGDPHSFHIDGAAPFLTQLGKTETHVISFVNDGTQSIVFGAPPSLGAPFTVDSSTGMNGAVVAPGASATITVTFAPAAATSYSQSVALSATDTAGAPAVTRNFVVSGSATINPPIHYSTDASALTFGEVVVGSSNTKPLAIVNDGSVALRFCLADIHFYDNSGSPLSGFVATNASFGAPCGFVTSGSTATVDVTYTPTEMTEPFRGIVRVGATWVNGDVVSAAIEVDGVVAAAAVDPAPVPPAPTPTSTSTPVAPTAAHPAAAASSARPGSLAKTGAEPGLAVGFGALTLLFGMLAVVVVRRGGRRGARR